MTATEGVWPGKRRQELGIEFISLDGGHLAIVFMSFARSSAARKVGESNRLRKYFGYWRRKPQ